MRVWGGLLLAGACVTGCRQSGPATEDRRPIAFREGGTERPAKLTFAVTPFWSEEEMKTRFLPVAEYIGRQAGLPVEWRWYDSYGAITDAVVGYEVHTAVLSPLTYVRAKRRNSALVLLAAPVTDGATTYSGYIVVRDDSSVQSVAELAGKRFAFVDEMSTSGYLLPLAYLRAQGFEPKTFFGSTVFAGDHGRLLEMLLAGEVDAGASYSSMLRKPEGKRLKILAKTGRIPLDAWCASPRLDQELIDILRAALVGLSTRTAEGRAVLTVSKTNGFRAVTDDHYDEVRRIYRGVRSPDGD